METVLYYAFITLAFTHFVFRSLATVSAVFGSQFSNKSNGQVQSSSFHKNVKKSKSGVTEQEGEVKGTFRG